VLANLFELVPVINGIKDKHIVADALSDATIVLLKTQMKLYLEDILGLKAETAADHKQLDGVMQLLMDLRKDAKKNKDFATSDRIRNQLAEMGIQLKDEKDGGMSYRIDG
jgi:cysteinyl-tRNA synthetase